MDSLIESYLDFDYGLAFIICLVLYGVYFFWMKKRAESKEIIRIVRWCISAFFGRSLNQTKANIIMNL